MSIEFIDLKTQYLDLENNIRERVQKVFDHRQFILGPEVAECEQALSQFCGAPYTVTCSNGTIAAMMAMMACDIGPGDEVIVPAFSFIATAETVLLLGAEPVYVDIDPKTFNLNTNQLQQALSKRTKAIMPVALYGQPADMDEINAFAQKNNLIVIEDAAQSFAAPYKNKKSCNLSRLAITSFFPAKPLGCYGDGGAIFTDSKELNEKLIEIRNHGQPKRYYHTRLGLNGRMDTLQCAILMAKLSRYSQEIEVRQQAANYYNEHLQKFSEKGVQVPILAEDRGSVWAQYTLRVKNREQLQKKLTELGVPTSIHYPMTMADQPAYKNKGRCLDITESRKAANEVISLPMHGDLKENTLKQIVTLMGEALG